MKDFKNLIKFERLWLLKEMLTQLIVFAEKLQWDGDTQIFFIIKEAKQTFSEFFIRDPENLFCFNITLKENKRK